MHERRYLPDRNVFKRYHPRIQSHLIIGYHRILASKYRWFVRHMTRCSERAFYTNASFSELAGLLDAYEVIDCGWRPSEWASVPWQYNVYKDSVTEVYRGPDSDPYAQGYDGRVIAYKCGGSWTAKFFFGRDCHYWRHVARDCWSMRHGGKYADRCGDEYSVGTFSHRESIKKVPDEVIYSVLRQMAAKKWGGFYDDEIDFILERSGLERRLL